MLHQHEVAQCNRGAGVHSLPLCRAGWGWVPARCWAESPAEPWADGAAGQRDPGVVYAP